MRAAHHFIWVSLMGLTLCVSPPAAWAQSPTSSSERAFVLGSVGFGSTWDDEGLLGRGATVMGGVGIHLTPKLSLIGFVDRIRYYRDVEWLTFDGRVLFAGGEAAWQFHETDSGPYVTFGGGMLSDSGTWIRKTLLNEGRTRVDEIITRDGTHAAMTGSAGVDIPVSRKVMVRGGVRFYGLLDTGDDLFPHIIITPGVGAIVRF